MTSWRAPSLLGRIARVDGCRLRTLRRAARARGTRRTRPSHKRSPGKASPSTVLWRVRVRTSARTGGRAPRGLAQDLAHADWRARRTHHASEFPLDRLLARKHNTIALLLPAREVAQPIAPIAQIAAQLKDVGLLDEVLVIDAASEDDTATIAREAGLPVAQESELLSEYGPARGKGDAMWRGLAATTSEIVAFVDTDTADFHQRFILGLVGPLLCDPDIQLVKGTFRRPFRSGSTVLAEGGGRVTELMARPLLNLHAPELTVFEQPLAGETAARRDLLEQIHSAPATASR